MGHHTKEKSLIRNPCNTEKGQFYTPYDQLC